jgi:rod shape-determining protein MreC
VQQVIAPISEAASTVREGIQSAWGRYVYLVHTSGDNQALRAQVADLQRELAQSNEFNRENERLKSLLRVTHERRVDGIAARVIGGDPSGWVRGILVDQGESSGVKEGMAVIHAQGLVGQVVAVSSTSARVLLVSDHASGVDVLHEESRARGVVEGAGEQVCELTFVTKDAQVKPGDAIITSGMDTVYPKGVLVGRISRVGQSAGALFQTIEVEPAVDFSKVEEVLIVSSGLQQLVSESSGSSRGGQQ